MIEIRDDYVAAIEAENGVLRERVAALEDIIGMKVTVPLIFPLTAQETKLFGVLMNRDLVTKETAMFALYSTRPNGENVEIKIIDVFICKIRAKLKKFDIAIETVWGQGYRLTPETKAKVAQYMAQSAEVAA